MATFKIAPNTASAYCMPGADPGEGYAATNAQLFGSSTASTPDLATNLGFVSKFDSTLVWGA